MISSSAAARCEASTVHASGDGRGTGERTIFQSDWWLEAVAGGDWTKLEVRGASGSRAWLPMYRYRRMGLPMIGMPPLTPVLGPVVSPDVRSAVRRELLRALIAEIPAHSRFNQVFTANDDVAYIFALGGFAISSQFSEIVRPSSSESECWRRLGSKNRNIVKKGRVLFDVDHLVEPDEFYGFLNRNMGELGRRNKVARPLFMRAAAAAHEHEAFACLGARTRQGRLAAAIVLVWDSRRLYYLLSTRDPALAVNAGTTLLIWEALLIASRKGLVFDFEGYGTPGAAAFIGSFGGQAEARSVVTGASRMGAVLTSTQQLWRAVRARRPP